MKIFNRSDNNTDTVNEWSAATYDEFSDEAADAAAEKRKLIISIVVAAIIAAAMAVVCSMVLDARTVQTPGAASLPTVTAGTMESYTDADGLIILPEGITGSLPGESVSGIQPEYAETVTAPPFDITTRAPDATVPTTVVTTIRPTVSGETTAQVSTTRGTPMQSETTATTRPSGGVTAASDEQAKAAEQIGAFFNHKCYIEGTAYQDGTDSPIAIAFDGEDCEVYTKYEGIEIAIMKKGDKLYIKRPDMKQYIEMNSTMASALGFSVDDLSINLGSTDSGSVVPASVSNTTLNGEAAVCYKYKTDNGSSEFYVVNGQIKEIDVKDNELNTLSKLQVALFSPSLPSDKLNLNGYTQAKSMFSMLSDVAQ